LGGGRPLYLARATVRDRQAAAVAWAAVKQQFWESGVLLVREAELDGLVESTPTPGVTLTGSRSPQPYA